MRAMLILSTLLLAMLTGSAHGASQSPTELLKQWYSTERCAERVPLMLDGQANAAGFNEWARWRTACTEEMTGLTLHGCDDLAVGKACEAEVVTNGILVNGLGMQIPQKQWLCVTRRSTDWLVDWRCSFGVSELPLSSFKALRPLEQPMDFRVFATLDDYFNYEWTGKEATHYAVRLQDREGDSVVGYVKKTSATGKALGTALGREGNKPFIMTLRYGKEVQDSGQVVIDGIVQEGFTRRRDEVPSPAPPNPYTEHARTPAPEGVAVVEAYLNTERCADRSAHIKFPQDNRVALAEHYRDVPSCTKKYEPLKPEDCMIGEEEACNVYAAFVDDIGAPAGGAWYCMDGRDGTWKVDWRCSIGWSEHGLPRFKADREEERPQLFRVRAALSDYFNYQFRGLEQTHLSLRLTDNAGEYVNAYVPRDSPTGRQAWDMLRSGGSVALLAEIVYPTDTQSTDLVELTWLQLGWKQWGPEGDGTRPSAPADDDDPQTTVVMHPTGTVILSLAPCEDALCGQLTQEGASAMGLPTQLLVRVDQKARTASVGDEVLATWVPSNCDAPPCAVIDMGTQLNSVNRVALLAPEGGITGRLDGPNPIEAAAAFGAAARVYDRILQEQQALVDEIAKAAALVTLDEFEAGPLAHLRSVSSELPAGELRTAAEQLIKEADSAVTDGRAAIKVEDDAAMLQVAIRFELIAATSDALKWAIELESGQVNPATLADLKETAEFWEMVNDGVLHGSSFFGPQICSGGVSTVNRSISRVSCGSGGCWDKGKAYGGAAVCQQSGCFFTCDVGADGRLDGRSCTATSGRAFHGNEVCDFVGGNMVHGSCWKEPGDYQKCW